MPIVYVMILVWYLGNLLVNRLGPRLVGIGIVLAGVPFYWYWRRRAAIPPAQANEETNAA